MKPSVYIETSIVSYLTARPSRDLIVAANQELTREWWESSRNRFDLFTSQIVIAEASAGDEQAAQKRLEALRDILLVTVSDEAKVLAERFLSHKALPLEASEDALHIAVATVHRMDYLLTWNCRHIANAQIRKSIDTIASRYDYSMPVICTPQELIGE